MDRRHFVTGSAALAAGTLAAPAIVRAATEIPFYYPVAVGGPITKIIDGYAADFEKENPGIKRQADLCGHLPGHDGQGAHGA